jgi:hypothetical protein
MSADQLRALGRHWARKYRAASPGVRFALAELLRELALSSDEVTVAYTDGCADLLRWDDTDRATRIDWIN